MRITGLYPINYLLQEEEEEAAAAAAEAEEEEEEVEETAAAEAAYAVRRPACFSHNLLSCPDRMLRKSHVASHQRS